MTPFKHQIGQWTIEVDGDNLSLANIGQDGKKRYFEIVMGKYSPVIIQEPDLAFYPPITSNAFKYVDVSYNRVIPDEKIVGVIQTGDDEGRFSLTSASDRGIGIVDNADGSLMVNGELCWIIGLYKPDGNRLKGYVAFTARERHGYIKVLEMGDLRNFPEIFE